MQARVSVQQFASWVYIGPDIFFPSVKYICSKCCLRYFEEIMPNWKHMDSPIGFSYCV